MKRSPRSYPRFSFRAGSVSDGDNSWMNVFLDSLLSQRMTEWVLTLHHLQPVPLTSSPLLRKRRKAGAILYIPRQKIPPSGMLFKHISSKEAKQ